MLMTMLMPTTIDVVRAMGGLARRADAVLAHSAARNAALGLADREARRLEDARTLRDLRRLNGAASDLVGSDVTG